MNIKPIEDRILIEQHKKELVSTALVLTKELEEGLKLPQGTIVAIGVGEIIDRNGLQVGDVVCFNEFAGERVMYEDKEYVLLRAGEVLAKKV